jgi:hypothetical protein
MFRLVTSLIFAVFAASASIAAPAEADAMLAQLSKIRLDKKQIYSVRGITLNRDVLSISLNRGALAFTETVDGKVTGAVFLGSGDILAIPPDTVEKQQVFRFTKSALLNEHFETAVFRFTDGTFDEILKQHRARAQEPVDAEVVDELLRWESEVQRRAAFLNERILADLIGNPDRPFFLAQIEAAQRGWFDAIYDERRTEEVFIQQNTSRSDQPLVWASFNKRSEVRDREAFAHEDKAISEIVSVNDDGTLLKLKMLRDGERVLELPPLSARITEVHLGGNTALTFSQKTARPVIVLPEPSRTGAEINLRVTYAAEDPAAARLRWTSRTGSIAPAGYRDQWIIEGLSDYSAVAADPQGLSQARAQLLELSSEGGTYESLGPVSIGFRMTQPGRTPGSVAALRNKSLWIIHMLRQVLQTKGGDSAFPDFLADIQSQFLGKSISTYDFKRLAEKHAGKSLDWFFDSWVFGTGVPAYTLDYKIDPSPGGFVVSGSVTQSGVPVTFEIPVPLYADDVLLGMVEVSSDGGDFRFTTRTRPMQVRVDPHGTILTQ